MQKNYQFGLYTVLTTVIIFIVIGGFNLVIDPYGVYRLVRIPGVNVYKPVVYTNSRWAKAQAIEMIRPRSLVLGDSRTEIGIDPDSVYWRHRTSPSYNLSIASGNMQDTLAYFKYANSIVPIKHVILGLDLLMFKAGNNPMQRAGFSWLEGLQQRPRATDIPKNRTYGLFSLNASKASIQTILAQHGRDIAPFYANGMRDTTPLVDRQARVGVKRQFLASEKNFIYRHMYARTPTGEFLYAAHPMHSPGLDAFRELLDICVKSNIDIVVFISPVHARQLEIIRNEGSWDIFEEWERQIVNIVDLANKQLPKNDAIPLWDFADYNAITMELPPAIGNKQASMKWYWESSHYKSAVGEIILEKIFDAKSKKPILNGFGTPLDKRTIEAHLSEIRRQQQNYANMFPGEISDVQSLFARPVRKLLPIN